MDGFVDLENISIDKNGKITGTNKDTGDPVVVATSPWAVWKTSMACFIPRAPTIRRAMPLGISRVGTPGNSVTGNLRNDKITDGNNVVDPDSALAEAAAPH